MKDYPGGSYLVISNTPIVPSGRPLMAIGYKYKYRNFLVFIVTEVVGSTEPGDPYAASHTYLNYNFSVRPIVFPHLLGSYSMLVTQ